MRAGGVATAWGHRGATGVARPVCVWQEQAAREARVVETAPGDCGRERTFVTTPPPFVQPPPPALVTPPPLCDIPSGCCSFTGPWTVTRSSLRMLLRVAAFCRPLRPVLLLVSFPRSRSPVVGVLGLC